MTDSNAADVYSFGIMLWAMVVGKEPYEDVENMVQLALQVTQQDKRPPIVPGIPPMLATIMQACWALLAQGAADEAHIQGAAGACVVVVPPTQLTLVVLCRRCVRWWRWRWRWHSRSALP